ncbi:MAG: isoamylase early set domain-containing protein [Gemmatimonadota bacterium]
MRRELQTYLDGEMSLNELPAELREEAERWERLVGDMRELNAERAPTELEQLVLSSLPARRRQPAARRQPALRRAASWVARPRTIRISPLAGLAAAAAIALVLLLPRGEAPTPQARPESGAMIYVQFVLEAPSANTVAVAGDFNDWSPNMVLTDPEGDGIWTGRVALKPGVHQYMFVIDGTQWTTDPRADRYTDDGFGNRNAVLVIAQPTTRS